MLAEDAICRLEEAFREERSRLDRGEPRELEELGVEQEDARPCQEGYELGSNSLNLLGSDLVSVGKTGLKQHVLTSNIH